jgi:hypothetical protein
MSVGSHHALSDSLEIWTDLSNTFQFQGHNVIYAPLLFKKLLQSCEMLHFSISEVKKETVAHLVNQNHKLIMENYFI